MRWKITAEFAAGICFDMVNLKMPYVVAEQQAWLQMAETRAARRCEALQDGGKSCSLLH